MAALIVLDNAQQIQGFGIANVHGDSALGKGFCRVPVLRSNQMLNKMDKRAKVLRVFCHLTHELAHGLRVFASFASGHALLRPGRNREMRILKPRLERGHKHGAKGRSQQNDQYAG